VRQAGLADPSDRLLSHPIFKEVMYAIVDIAGQQFKVSKDQRLKVHRLEAEEGKVLELDRVLLVSNGSNVTVGTPIVDGARVAAQVMAHSKGDKVLVFHKKRRKGYQKMNGHRQALTELLVWLFRRKHKQDSTVPKKN